MKEIIKIQLHIVGTQIIKVPIGSKILTAKKYRGKVDFVSFGKTKKIK